MNRVSSLCFIGMGSKLTVMRLYFCLVHPLFRASGKDKTMKRIPKTPIEFDYDLWTTEDGKCMVRVKRTGEVAEVQPDVMKVLRYEERYVRKNRHGIPNEYSENGEKNTLLSLDFFSYDDGEDMSSLWLIDPNDEIKSLEFKWAEKELIDCLTDIQREIYIACFVEGMSPSEYARKHGKKRQSVADSISYIRKKAKKIF